MLQVPPPHVVDWLAWVHATAQTPLLHIAGPLALLHTLPQPPQLFTSLFRLISQPLPALPSQFPKPELQLMLQAPPEHDAVPCVLLHTKPQEPQLLVSEDSDFSQPSVVLPLQLP
jgi:hypothetical protein